jgi:dolichyl-phosphate-mannose--protein O-mannosyl transferase
MIGATVLSIISIGCAYLLWCIADRRGANTLFWAIMGALFGPLAIPFIFLTRKQSSLSKPSSNE